MKTDFQANLNLNHDLGGVMYTPPVKLYIGLSSTPIQKNGAGATEPSSSMGYQRVEINNNSSTWSTALNGSKYNLVDLSFPEATGAWGTLTHVFLSDSPTSSSGNIRYFESLPKPRVIQENATMLFKQRTLTFKDE